MILFPHSVENNINVLKSPCKVPDDHDGGDDHGRFIQILSFSTDFREKSPVSNFTKIRLVGGSRADTCGQTDRRPDMTKLRVAVRYLCKLA